MDQVEFLAQHVHQASIRMAQVVSYAHQLLPTVYHVQIVLDVLYANQHLLYILEQIAVAKQHNICKVVNAILAKVAFLIA